MMQYLINGHKYTEKDLLLAYVATDQVSYKIIQGLKERVITTSGLAKKLGINRNLVSYHLLQLMKYGWIDGELEITKMPTEKQSGKAKTFYSLNKNTFERVKKLFIDISEELT